MENIERIFKRYIVTFILFVSIVVTVVGNFIQGVSKTIGEMLTSVGICESNGCILFVDLVVLALLFVISILLIDPFINSKIYGIKLDWEKDKHHGYESLRIINNDTEILEECTGRLFGKIEKPYGSIQKFYDPPYKIFSWSNKADREGTRKSINIPVGNYGLLDIVKVEEGKLHFCLANMPDKKIGKENGIYKFYLQITAKKNGQICLSEKKRLVVNFHENTVKLELDR